MKKTKKTLLTAALLTAAVNVTACDSGFQCVYGPPPDLEDSSAAASAENDPNEDEAETTASTAGYEPNFDEIQDVYGPPVDLDAE